MVNAGGENQFFKNQKIKAMNKCMEINQNVFTGNSVSRLFFSGDTGGVFEKVRRQISKLGRRRLSDYTAPRVPKHKDEFQWVN